MILPGVEGPGMREKSRHIIEPAELFSLYGTAAAHLNPISTSGAFGERLYRRNVVYSVVSGFPNPPPRSTLRVPDSGPCGLASGELA